MSGFPTRPSRSAFGPRPLVDRFPVRDPSKEIGAVALGLSFWQIAGLGLVSPLAWALFHWSGSGTTCVLDAAAESWDPDSLVTPTLSRPTPGVYTVTYAATYPDENGVAIATDLKWCMVVPQDTTLAQGIGSVSSSRIVNTVIKKSSDLSAYDPTKVLVIVG